MRAITCLILIIAAARLPDASGQTVEPKPIIVTVVTRSMLRSFICELRAEDTVKIEVVDLKTGENMTFNKSDLKSITKNTSESTAIDRVGLATYMAWRIKRLLPSPTASGKVAQVDGATVYVSLGSQAGIEVGDHLNVCRGGDDVKDPDTGEILGKRRRKVAVLHVVDVKERLSTATVVGDAKQLEVGDVVEPLNLSNSLAVLPFVTATGHETVAARRMAEELTTGLVNRGLSVVERRLLDKVFGELTLQQGAAFDAAKAQQVGKQLGAYAVVVGTIAPKGQLVEAQCRVVRVETGEILAAATQVLREAGLLDPLPNSPPAPASVPAAVDIPKAPAAADVVPSATPAADPAGVRSAVSDGHGLAAEYFSGVTFNTSLLKRIDANIDWIWADRSADRLVPHDQFSARWEGYLKAPRPGMYRLIVTCDDGVRVWLDNQLIINGWQGQLPTRFERSVALGKGPHALRVEYFQDIGASMISLRWAQEGGWSERAIPRDALFHDLNNARREPVPLPAAELPTNGLQVEGFAGDNFNIPIFQGTARNVDHLFGYTPPDPRLADRDYSIRWTGSIVPLPGGPSELVLVFDDGLRIWLGDKLIVDQWFKGEPRRTVAPISFTSTDPVPIRVEYFNRARTSGIVSMRLRRSEESWDVPFESASFRRPTH